MKFKDGQKVMLKSVVHRNGDVVELKRNHVGRVVRRRLQDDGAWIALEGRLSGDEESLHPFPANDEHGRATHVLAFPEDLAP